MASEKAFQLNEKVNLVICQKSKIEDWINHLRKYYVCHALDLTCNTGMVAFLEYIKLKAPAPVFGVINYELFWRREELFTIDDFTLICDESGLLTNESTKRTKGVMRLNYKNIILLSGSICGGKYELLWSQMHLLGWKISKSMYWDQYVRSHYEDVSGFPLKIVDGYKNVDRLKRKMREHGCLFLKTEEVMDLPEQVFQKVHVPVTTAYKKFMRDRIITVGDKELVGDTTLTKLLYARMLCGVYSVDKLNAFKDLIESTDDRVIVFYNFTSELDAMQEILMDEDYEYSKRFSVVNGSDKHLQNYEDRADSITFVQYQAGAMGLNLQKACRIIYFTPPLSSELYQQSMKRIHRIGQGSTCFYYKLICKGSVEERIYGTLKKRKDYTEALFESGK